ncbi:hypothetical protein BDU57DRAFT_539888 [Ampelomyces quisqualis]|uniref:Uncharacterized protein n=1 Tax=Ampelomyces quisqualis TaxID=50730 RepID=A0A6A5QIX2_AMPQU|nr:hypothetical protein BDU57DRAFT_539888 [Ampelomyces quisqualis]
MKSLKNKASRFFKDVPSQDEHAANAGPGESVGFDAGIQSRAPKSKPSRFFQRKNDKTDKPLPMPLSNGSSWTLAVSEERVTHGSGSQRELPAQKSSFQFPLAPLELADSPAPSSHPSSTHSSNKPEVDAPKVKPRPSFAALKSKSSRLFRNNDSDHSPPPPPPVPQLPVDPTEPLPRPRVVTPRHSSRKSHSSSISLYNGSLNISRPALLPQYSSPPIPENPITVDFIKPSGPPPPRPPRPESLDDDTIALMQQGGTRMVLFGANRFSDSTASSTTKRSHSSSIEARLGFPSGMSTPRTDSLDSPLAVRFPLDVLQPLPVRDSTGSVRASRFSQWVRHEYGGYAGDGVEEDDRDLGPIEQYDRSKENEWRMEKRISQGPNGNPGMLFRDGVGAFHFVADI